jgi:CHAT domain-containing protein/tetratricopeptide (TPR) repeat protein
MPSLVQALLFSSLLASSGSRLAAQASPSNSQQACAAEVGTQASETCTLARSETTHLRVSISTGQVRLLVVEQLEGTVEVGWQKAAGSSPAEPFSNKAGLHSTIKVLLSPNDAGIALVELVNTSRADHAAKISLSAAEQHAANPESEKEQSAEASLAHATWLRSHHPEKSTEVLAACDRAIALWEALGDRPSLARALTAKASYLSRSDPAAAEPVIQRAVDLGTPDDTAEAASRFKAAGIIAGELTHYDAANADLNKSLALYQAAGDAVNVAYVYQNLATFELDRADTTAALAHLRTAQSIAGGLGDPRLEIMCLNGIGAVYVGSKDFESAYKAYEQVLILLKRDPDNPEVGYIWAAMEQIYEQAGDHRRALDALDQAMAFWKRNPDVRGELITILGYGDVYFDMNQIGKAQEMYRKGLNLGSSRSQEYLKAYFITGIGMTQLEQGNLEGAKKSLLASIDLAKKLDVQGSLTATFCGLGDIAVRQDHLEAARSYYARCDDRAKSMNSYTIITAKGGLARLSLKSGDPEEALRHAEESLGAIESIGGHLDAQELKTSFFSSVHSYYDVEVQILEALARKYPQDGYEWKAFLAGERSRSRTLLDEVNGSVDLTPPGASPALLAQYDDVQRRLRQLDGASYRRDATVTSSITRLTLEEHQLRAEIRAAGDAAPAKPGDPSTIASAGNTNVPTPQRSSAAALSLAGLQSALPDSHSMLVEYWVGETASYGWAISRASIRSFRLPPEAQLDRLCAAFRKSLLAQASRDPRLSAEQRAAAQPAIAAEQRRLATQLAVTLFPGDLLARSLSTLVLVGDGAVNAVPFAAVAKLADVSPARAGLRRISFLNEPSATIFSLLESKPITGRPLRVAIFSDSLSHNFADASYALAKPEPTAFAGGSHARGDLSPLPFAHDEAAMLRQIFGAAATQSFAGTVISPENLQTLDWSEFSIGHFAMHAILNERYAELTGLSLGNDAHSGTPKMLWYGDVCRLHARLDLVVLSACNTALGESLPGEGLVGLTQAFFAAGAQRVLGTLWEVDDQATSEWMRHYYLALRETHSPTGALRKAQQAMAADPQWSAPYYWAGFVLAGDWRPLP